MPKLSLSGGEPGFWTPSPDEPFRQVKRLFGFSR